MDHVPSQFEHDADVGGGDGRAVLSRGTARWVSAGLALLATALFLGLAVWQVERRAWKLDLIERVEARLHAPSVPLPRRLDWHRLEGRDYEYRRVRAEGAFLHDRETLVQALTERGAGWWVMTPLRTAEGIVLVNRGFVPDERRDSASRGAGKPRGTVPVTGLMRVSEPGGGFLRANDPAAERWYSRDVAAIARARSLGPVAPFFIDADASSTSGGYPAGGLTVVRFRNNHLVYAITWFLLAAMSAGAAFLVLRGPRRR